MAILKGFYQLIISGNIVQRRSRSVAQHKQKRKLSRRKKWLETRMYVCVSTKSTSIA